MPYPVSTSGDFLGRTAPDAVLIGPGLGQSDQVEQLLLNTLPRIACPLVLDADGINIVARHRSLLDGRGYPTILTPHDGEFKRLSGYSPSEDRAKAASIFARRYHCVLVLKGHRTLVAAPDGTLYCNTTGNNGMAKGGSGDVLAGLMVSLLAQGMEAPQAAAAAVWIHGRAGDLAAQRWGQRGMTPSDLIDQLGAVWRSLED
jgi:NAD(P)H-hydrate epimerase